MSEAPAPLAGEGGAATQLLASARSQQQLAEESLLRLHSHTAGLDAIVRDEIHHSFVAECGALIEEARAASEALAHLHRSARGYFGWSCIVTVLLSMAAALMAVRRQLPSAAELVQLRQQESLLRASVAQLSQLGGRVTLRRCGPSGRLCVEVDLSAPVYGPSGDYYILKGY
jgi:hypothetical protein